MSTNPHLGPVAQSLVPQQHFVSSNLPAPSTLPPTESPCTSGLERGMEHMAIELQKPPSRGPPGLTNTLSSVVSSNGMGTTPSQSHMATSPSDDHTNQRHSPQAPPSRHSNIDCPPPGMGNDFPPLGQKQHRPSHSSPPAEVPEPSASPNRISIPYDTTEERRKFEDILYNHQNYLETMCDVKLEIASGPENQLYLNILQSSSESGMDYLRILVEDKQQLSEIPRMDNGGAPRQVADDGGGYHNRRRGRGGHNGPPGFREYEGRGSGRGGRFGRPLAAGEIQKTIQVPSDAVGLVIGTRGQTINHIRSSTGADVQVDKDFGGGRPGPEGYYRNVVLQGRPEQIEQADGQIQQIVRSRARYGNRGGHRGRGHGPRFDRGRGYHSGHQQCRPNNGGYDGWQNHQQHYNGGPPPREPYRVAYPQPPNSYHPNPPPYNGQQGHPGPMMHYGGPYGGAVPVHNQPVAYPQAAQAYPTQEVYANQRSSPTMLTYEVSQNAGPQPYPQQPPQMVHGLNAPAPAPGPHGYPQNVAATGYAQPAHMGPPPQEMGHYVPANQMVDNRRQGPDYGQPSYGIVRNNDGSWQPAPSPPLVGNPGPPLYAGAAAPVPYSQPGPSPVMSPMNGHNGIAEPRPEQAPVQPAGVHVPYIEPQQRMANEKCGWNGGGGDYYTSPETGPFDQTDMNPYATTFQPTPATRDATTQGRTNRLRATK